MDLSNESNILGVSDENSEIHVYENSREIMIRKLFNLFIRHKLTLTALEDTAKLINSMPGATFNLPTTKYLLIKEMLNQSHLKVSQHFLCNDV